jgi:hypothetical protein
VAKKTAKQTEYKLEKSKNESLKKDAAAAIMI